MFQRAAAITGSVRTEAGGRADAAMVVLFPADAQSWNARDSWALKSRLVRVRDGKFAIDDLAPGSYFLLAVDDAELEDWPSRDTMAQLAPRATPVTLAVGTRIERALIAKIK